MTPFFDKIRQRLTTDRDKQPEQVPEGPPPYETIVFGGLELPDSESTSHFLCLGTTGSGKTIIVRLLMQSVLPWIGTGLDRRALVYDAKQDMLPLLGGICPDVQVRTMNPFDARGVAWDICADVREPRVAVEIAFTLIPSTHESQPFFADAARHLMYGVMVSYMLSGHEWTFADLIRGLSSPRRLKGILKKHAQTRDLISAYFYDKRLLSNIMSTIATKLLAFGPIAGAWEDAQEKYSLTQWVQDELILVLGNSEISRTAIDALNRCIFKRASDLTLALPESFSRRNWFFIDELSEAGRLDGIVSLLKKGRSKGAAVAISMQGTSGLKDERLYGPYLTAELLAQIGNRFIGRVEDPDCADFLSRLIGEQEVDQFTRSETHSTQSGPSTTTNHQIVTRRAVLPSELMSVDSCTRGNGLTGYFMVRSAGCYKTTLDGDELFDEALIPPDPNVPEFIARPVETQFIQPWTDERAASFGVPPPKSREEKRRQRPKQQQSPSMDPLAGLDDLDS
jgi:type IV secretory pathway TraG/TraD family ATPase VirD4